MIDSGRLPSAMLGLLVLLFACSPSTSSPAQMSPGVPTTTQPTPTAASVTPSPTAASSTARRSPVPLRTVRPSDLVVRIDMLGELCCPSPTVVATVDGRLVTKTGDGTLVERRLAVAGVERLRNEVLGTGLFDGDRVIGLDPAPGATPAPHGISARTFRVWTGTRTVIVTSMVLAPSDEAFYTPSPVRKQLDALAARLTAPESWLPASDWAVMAPRPYVADGFRVVTSTEPVGGSQPDVDAVAWPFNPEIPDFGEPLAASSGIFVPIGPGIRPLRCATLDASDARAARDVFERGGATVADFPDGAFATGLTWRTAGTGIVLFFQAIMPDQSSCADAY